MGKRKYINFIYFVYAIICGAFSYVAFDAIINSISVINILFGVCAGLFIYILLLFLDDSKEKYPIIGRITAFLNHTATLSGVIVAAFRYWYMSHFIGYVIYYDTASYTNYEHNILKGEVDVFRTPVYPLFLKLIRKITGIINGEADYYKVVVAAQVMISFIGVIIFYFALAKLFKNKWVVFSATLLFGCNPIIIQWDNCILTESLSVFMTVFFLYIMLDYLKNPTKLEAILMSLLSFCMVMLRPTFIYLFAILGVFFVTRFILYSKDRIKSVCGAISLIVAVCLTLGYCQLNKNTNGYFGISSVSTTVNQLYIVMQNGITDNPDYPDITYYIEFGMECSNDYIGDIIEPAGEIYGYTEIENYVNGCIAANRDIYNEYTKNKFLDVAVQQMTVQYSVYDSEAGDFARTDQLLLHSLFPFTFAAAFIIIAAAVAFAIGVLIVKRRISWQIIGISAIAFSHLFVSVYGSMAEYQRLSLMAVPCIIAIIFFFVDAAVGAMERKTASERLDSYSLPVKFKSKEETR